MFLLKGAYSYLCWMEPACRSSENMTTLFSYIAIPPLQNVVKVTDLAVSARHEGAQAIENKAPHILFPRLGARWGWVGSYIKY
jgi:hypothetical protein